MSERSPGVAVRAYCEADRAALRVLYATTWNAAYGPTLGDDAVAAMLADLDDSDFRAMLPGADERAAVAVCGGSVVGSLIGAERDGIAYLWGMYVLPSHQRRGVGTALMAHVAAGLAPTTRLEVRVFASSPWAMAFYRKHGFRDGGREDLEYAPGRVREAAILGVTAANLLAGLTRPA